MMFLRSLQNNAPLSYQRAQGLEDDIVLKLSRYIHELTLPDGTLVLANVLWGTTLELSDSEAEEWKLVKQTAVQQSAFIERLLSLNMLLDPDFDELKFIQNAYRDNRHSSDILGLTIAPTIDCNLACVYCYEDKKKGLMGEDVMRQIETFVDQMLPGKRRFNVIWYGGEPLICKETVLRLSRHFSDSSIRNDVSYSAQMTTNGLLLDSATVDQMVSIGGWTRIQVTLDGAAQFHDSRRPDRAGRGTFSKIYANLKYASDRLPISLRMNIDIGNVKACYDLLKQLAMDMATERIHVYFSPIHFYGKGCRDVADGGTIQIANNKEFAKINLGLTDLARNLGFDTNNDLKKPSLRSCQAISSHSFIIEPDGSLQRCWTEVGELQTRIGRIGEDIQLTEPNVLRWLKFDPTRNAPCKDCDVLPTCFGGCPQRHMDGRPQEMICSSIKFNTREKLVADYLATHRPDLKNTKALILPEPASTLVHIAPYQHGKGVHSTESRIS